MITSLRPYQAAAVDTLLAELQQHDGVIYCAPTASGKTVVAAALINRCVAKGQRVLVICHRAEILDQTSRKLADAGVPHGLIAAGRAMDKEHPVQVAMVMSLPKRAKGLDPDIIIFDECHHISAPTWKKIADRYPQAKRLGLTATPQRLDRRPLTPVFAKIVMAPPAHELREAGYLAEFVYFAPDKHHLQTLLDGVKTTLGDYDKQQLGRMMSDRVLIGDAVEHFARLGEGRRALAFSVDIASSRHLLTNLLQ